MNSSSKVSNKIKLCLVLNAPQGGGAERVMINLSRKLSREKFDLSFIFFNTEGEYVDLIPKDIALVDLKMKLPGPYELTNPFWIFKLSVALRKAKPQVIFCTLGYTNLMVILAKLLAHIPSKLIIRETTIKSQELKNDKWHTAKKLVYKCLYHLADCIVSPTSAAAEDLTSFFGISPDRLKVIANFVETEFIDQKLSEPWPEPLKNLKRDKPVVISVGRLSPVKGITSGIKAFCKAQKESPCYYWIVGQGPDADNLKRIAEEYHIADRIFFLGFQANPYLFMAQADIFLLPSRFEGFPNSLLEAMYCKVPGIVTKHNSSVDQYFSNGADGFQVNVDDIDAMANAIEKLVKNNTIRKRMGAQAGESVKKFKLEYIIKFYEDLFIQTGQK